MSATLDLKAAERKAYQLSTSQDGLYDIFFGSYIILLSAAPWLDENGLPSPWSVILPFGLGMMIFLCIMLIKKFVVAPRIGQVRFGTERKRRLKRLSIAMIVIFLLTLTLFALTVSAIYFREPILTGAKESGRLFDPVHIAAGIFIFVIFSVIGYVIDNVRLYAYGFLYGLGYVVSTVLQELIGIQFYWPMAVAGLVPVITGLVLFVWFLRTYPLRAEADLVENH